MVNGEESAMEQTVTAASEQATGAAALEDTRPAVVRLRVATPGDNARVELPEVPVEVTPAGIIEQLVRQGFLPAPAAGRAYVMALRGGQLLQPEQSLGAAGVPDGATLQTLTDTPGAALLTIRPARLEGDHLEMTRIRGSWIGWKGEGGPPPEAYVVTYHLPSYLTAWFTRRMKHRVRFDLPPRYPGVPPIVSVLDRPAVFHPNVRPVDGRICLGTWSPDEGLAFVVLRVARMLLYYPQATGLSAVANPEAAVWYGQHRSRFPLCKDLAFPDPLTGAQVKRAPSGRIRIGRIGAPR